MTASLASVLAAGTVLSPPAQASGLVANGDFEASQAGWFATPAGNGSPLSRAGGGHSGSWAAQVTNVTAGAATAVLNDSPNTVASTTAGRTYHASAWMKADRPGTSLVLRALEYAGSTRGASGQTSLWATDTSWHQLSLDVTATTNGATIDLNMLVWGLPAGGSFLVDDVDMVVPGSPPVVTPPPPVVTPPPPVVTPPPPVVTPPPPVVTPPPPVVTPPPPATGSPLPAQGTGALFGYYQAGNADPRQMEAKIGRKFDLVHHYQDFNALNQWPNAAEVAEAAEGRTVHIGWELQSYGGGYDGNLQPAPGGASTNLAGVNRRMWTYSQVNNGSLDRYLDAIAGKVKASPGTYVVDIDHEMDDRPDVGGAGTLRAATGSRAEFVQAYRHIVDRFRARGVTNVTWAWTLSGWYAADASKAWSLQQLWPGSNYVDVIMWDPYNNRASNWRSFAQLVTPTYNAIQNGALDAVDPRAKDLPMGLAEYGSLADSRRPDWFRALPGELRRFPALVTLGYFNSGSWADFTTDAASIAAFADAGRDPYLHTRG